MRVGSRSIVPLAVIAAVASGGLTTWARAAVVPGPAACASPTRTLGAGGGQDMVVAAGEVLSLTAGVYTGRIDLRGSGTLCVATGAALNPKSLQDPAGGLIIAGTAELPTFTAAPGFTMHVSGSATIGNVTLPGQSGVTVTTSGSVTGGSLLTKAGAVIDNAGTLDARLTTNTLSTLINSGRFTARTGLAIQGSLRNSGHLSVTGGPLRLDLGATMTNECVIESQNDVTVESSSGVVNAGIVRADAAGNTLRVTKLATYQQTSVGITVTGSLHNLGAITGFGRYRFAGTTHSTKMFAGSSAQNPILVQDLTPPAAPNIFDQQSGSVVNSIARAVADPPAGATVATCRDGSATPVADVTVTNSGPATVVPGGTVTYSIKMSNLGPVQAAGLTVTDTLPPALGAVSATGGGVVNAGKVTWTRSALATDTEVTYTVRGTAPATGTLIDRVAGTAGTFDPNPGNNDGSSSAHRVTTTVVAGAAPNKPPTTGATVYSGRAGVPIVGAVPLADPNPQQQVRATLTSPPAKGTATVQATGMFEYRPTGTFTGTDKFTVTGCDNGAPPACTAGTQTMVIAPAAEPDTATTQRGTAVSIPVLFNDFGDVADGPTVTVRPGHGTADRAGTGVTYRPAAGYAGTDTFTYRTCSGGATAACGVAAVTVTVTAPGNRPPNAADVRVTGSADTTIEGTVAASDPDSGQHVTVSLATPPAAGTAQVDADGTFSFTPPADTARVFTFTVRACDDAGPPACDPATVTATVDPVARPDAVLTPANTAAHIDVRGNDRGGLGTPTIVAPGPASGTAVVAGDGRITYTPATGHVGGDTFGYRVCAVAAPTLCASTDVRITVGAVGGQPNRPPTIEPADLTTTATRQAAISLNFEDPDAGQVATVSVTGAPDHGTTTVSEHGVAYRPQGTFTGRDRFTVQVCDDATPRLCATAPVSVTVLPVAGDDEAVVDANGSVLVPVQANDIGAAGPAERVTAAEHGIVEVADGGTIRFTPQPGYAGPDSFGYDRCATNAGDADVCATARVNVAVVPAAQEDAAATLAGVEVIIAVLNNDTAGPGNRTVRVVTQPVNGTVTVNATGSVTVTPEGDFTGSDSFGYEVCVADDPRMCSRASVALTVHPQVNDVVADTSAETSISMNVTVNDFGAATSPIVTKPPANGTVTGTDSASVQAFIGTANLLEVQSPRLVYTPLPGFAGADSFQYTRCSVNAPTVCSEATVVINVAPTRRPGREPAGPAPGGTPGGGTLPITGPAPALALGLVLFLAGVILRGLAAVAPARRAHYGRGAGIVQRLGALVWFKR